MKTLAFFLEEPSAREMLAGILPRLLPEGVHPQYLIFQGKQHLEKNLVKKLRGWRRPDTIFVVMRDQDAADCRTVKQKLATLCREAGRESVLIRIACRELESFYLGDLAAVEKGLGLSGLVKLRDMSRYKNPDELTQPADELTSLTGRAYQKVAGSRAIAPHLDLSSNRSKSFNNLLSGLRRILGSGGVGWQASLFDQ
jgi:hypothetical protein